MYVTKEVEVWLDPEDFEGCDGFFGLETVEDLLPLADAVRALHDEYHQGSVWICAHPACYSVRGALLAARAVGYEEPSVAALHHQEQQKRELSRRVVSLAAARKRS